MIKCVVVACNNKATRGGGRNGPRLVCYSHNHCKIEACSKQAECHSYCKMHEQRLRRDGALGPVNSKYQSGDGLDTELQKQCRHCRKLKANSEFPTYSRNNDGLDSWCRSCKTLASQRTKYVNSGIMSIEQLSHALNTSACEACGLETSKLCIDHDHETREYRGILCNGCNKALGFVNDDKVRLLQLVEYLGGL